MENDLIRAIMFLERIPAVEDIHVFETTHRSSDDGRKSVDLPVTLWFDDFQQELESDEDNPTPKSEKLDQLESIMSAYLKGITASIQESSARSGSHVIVLEQTRVWNPLSKLRRWGNSLRWRWHVWNANTHIDVTPLPMEAVGEKQIQHRGST